MGCLDDAIAVIGTAEFARRLRQPERHRLQVPYSASLDLTRRCNLHCVHCYVRPSGATDTDLPSAAIMRILERLSRGGVLFLVLTGGEPLLRPDFPELYRRVKELGIIPTLFTNATCLTPGTLDLLASLPPRRIEVTVYGHTARTYEAVTGVPCSHRRFREGVEALLCRGLLVRLKAMVLRSNAHELDAMKEWAESLGCEFRYDALVHPHVDGCPAPLAERLGPEEVAALQFRTPEDRSEFEHYLAELGDDLAPRRRLFECGAGSMTLHVDASGYAHPCMLWRDHPYPILEQDLDARWLDHIRRLQDLPSPAGECVTCRERGLCNCCPPLARLEAGGPTTPPFFYCRLAVARRALLGHAAGTPASDRP
jgi:MoaA/NifB/PqqE/SkfB family radical SAM enzyme